MLKGAAYAVNRFVLRRHHLTASVPRFGWKMRVVTKDVVGRHIYKYGHHEPATTEFLLSHLTFEDGDIAIDVGANIGWYSLLLHWMMSEKDGRVLAFEPDPANFSLLSQNLLMNGANRVDAIQKGVADKAGSMTLHLFGDNNRGRHSLLPINSGESVNVETVALDAYLEAQELSHRHPRFLKMDIEGFELIALRGASRVLERCPMVMLEYSPNYMRAGGLVPEELFETMSRAGHRPHVLKAGVLKPAEERQLLADQRHVDLFFLR